MNVALNDFDIPTSRESIHSPLITIYWKRYHDESCRCWDKFTCSLNRSLPCQGDKSSSACTFTIRKFAVPTSYQTVGLSNTLQTQPALQNQGFQVLVVDYNDQSSLQHAVMGVDTVISTVTGVPGMELLKACVEQDVRRFAPAEFEGLPSHRLQDDPLDRNNCKKNIRLWLDHYREHDRIESTIFSCGVLYERFGPGGLRAHRLGLNSQLDGEGDFIINVRNMTANAPIYDANNQPNVTICLTAAEDVARFVVKAIDLNKWPQEMTMVGERMTVLELLQAVQRARGT